MSIFSKKQPKPKNENKKIKEATKEIEEKNEEKEVKQSTEKEREIVLNNKNILLIKHPQVTEKSQLAREFRQYVFNVVREANKSEVKKAIEQIYNVNVEKVRMINVPAKKRRAGHSVGKKSGYKKAIITLKEGQQIEVIPQK